MWYTQTPSGFVYRTPTGSGITPRWGVIRYVKCAHKRVRVHTRIRVRVHTHVRTILAIFTAKLNKFNGQAKIVTFCSRTVSLSASRLPTPCGCTPRSGVTTLEEGGITPPMGV